MERPSQREQCWPGFSRPDRLQTEDPFAKTLATKTKPQDQAHRVGCAIMPVNWETQQPDSTTWVITATTSGRCPAGPQGGTRHGLYFSRHLPRPPNTYYLGPQLQGNKAPNSHSRHRRPEDHLSASPECNQRTLSPKHHHQD